MGFPRGIRRRIFFAFAVLIAILGLAMAASRQAHEHVLVLLEQVASDERAMEAVLRLSSAVRDQYAHQAHTVVLNDRSHLGHYEDSEREVSRTLTNAWAHLSGEANVETLAEIERLAELLSVNFRENIVPRVPGDPKALVAPHDTALDLVDDIVAQTDRLIARIGDRVERARVQAQRAQQEAAVRNVVFVLLGLGFAVGIGVYLDRSITNPIRELETGTRLLATGELATRVRVERDDELGSLARHFNQMAEALAVHQDKLVQSEKLAGIGRLAAGVAHEINNPLAVILGYARLISRSEDERVAADAKVISDEVQRCQEIVSGLLEFAKTPRLERETLGLAAVVQEAVERLGGHPLDVRVEGDARVDADEGKLQQILSNLLRNAQQAAPDSPVEVFLARQGATASVRIRDRGPGITDEARNRLFEPFFTTKADGTGLGLALASALATAHGGELALAETSADGTTFELRLPAATSKEVA